ncbi:MAG: hypothetical protein A2091_00610 [Desulfuromonadales bacterium GWD2_61_12]|nr:MAG: hypothetical protein A2005_11575 [Desulfuromonadales bacterium GWC2_61_20]OGR34802.1 MAG: hypothetical protein A2091_00610 [Desulfuromonadales bacterium GWD2_61_12]
MTRMVFLTPADGRDAFALAGVQQRVVDCAGVASVLHHLVADPETGVIVVDERLLPGLDEARLRALERSWRGVLLVLPAPALGAAAGPDYIRRLLRRVLGYQVRLER